MHRSVGRVGAAGPGCAIHGECLSTSHFVLPFCCTSEIFCKYKKNKQQQVAWNLEFLYENTLKG